MAARLTKRQATLHRESIRVSMLLNRLQDHVDGKVEMSQTQLRAAEVLLRKAMPDLKATDITTAGEKLDLNNVRISWDGNQPTAET
jgi:hypothetical protein